MILSEPTTPDGELTLDGRRVRGLRTRRRLAESLLALVDRHEAEPTGSQVAAEAGVSLRLLFHHYRDMESLYATAYQLQIERQWQRLPRVEPQLPLSERIGRTVRARSTLYESVSPLRLATWRRHARSPEIGALLAETHRALRAALTDTFAVELRGEGSADLLASLDAVSSWQAWEQLRHAQGLSVARARRTTAYALAALLSAAPAGAS